MAKTAPKDQCEKKCNCNCNCVKRARYYAATFTGGIVSGITGELFALWQNGNLNLKGITAPAFRDLVFISGVQQAAKDASKNALKKNPFFLKLSKENPLLFGACTGLPMWAITRFVATPLQNSRKSNTAPFDGFASSVVNDVTYHTFKNGLDEFCVAKVFPQILPNLSSQPAKLAVQGAVAAAAGGSCYVFAWPVKSLLTGQSLNAAIKQCFKATPKVGIKKITYTVARPKLGKLIE